MNKVFFIKLGFKEIKDDLQKHDEEVDFWVLLKCTVETPLLKFSGLIRTKFNHAVKKKLQ